ncbi:MAG TPA: hypothetical protein VGS27_20630 [Candidatus Sulfotelmatobacter sp.]|nr:hypothetical protein [Candidatus Sulfotelmatobacter sp.]
MTAPLNSELLTALRDFASCDLSLDRLRTVIHDAVGVYLAQRWLNLDAIFREPAVQITVEHVARALAMRRDNAITEEQLVDWATTLLTNSAFFWDDKDAKTVSEWIDGISLDLVPRSS